MDKTTSSNRAKLVKLLDNGEIPSHYAGTKRLLTMSDLIKYKQQRTSKSQESLRRMVELSEELGLYDE